MTATTLPAPLWRRLIAAVYDGLLLLGIVFTIALLDFVVLNKLLGLPTRGWLGPMLFLAGLSFFGWFWTHGGQTLGMRAWRLRVRRLDGLPLRWPVAAVRYAAMMAVWLALPIALALLYVPRFSQAHPHAELFSILTISLLVCALLFSRLDARRRAPQDWISGSEVVVEPKV
ncbi:MAG TPA: RDD family protein [Solimonas sp.]|nr:RDD family protein [Solimonas sp.]